MMTENTAPPEYELAQEWLKRHRKIIGNHSFYKGIEDGSIPHIKLGRKILVRTDALEIMARRQQES